MFFWAYIRIPFIIILHLCKKCTKNIENFATPFKKQLLFNSQSMQKDSKFVARNT